MKKFLILAAITVATLFISSCSKTDAGGGITASIVGGWENVSYSLSFTDKDGKAVSAREVVIALFKSYGMTDEQIASMSKTIDEAVAAMENTSTSAGQSRYYFETNGKFKTSTLNNDKWSEPEEVGAYSLDGNMLTLDLSVGEQDIKTRFTVLTLNNAELRLLGNSSGVEAYEKIGYNVKSVSVFRRL